MKIDRNRLYLRGAKSEDIEDFGNVIDRAFQKNHPGFEGSGVSVSKNVNNLEDVRLILVKQDDGNEKVLGACPIIQYPCHYGSNILESGGLSVVGVDPDYQRNGLGQLMLEDAEKYMFEKNYDIGLLFTGSPNFYRHKGWEMAIENYEYEINISDIPKFDSSAEYKIKELKIDDLEELCMLYESFNKELPLTKVRNLNWWISRFSRFDLSKNIKCIFKNKKLIAYYWIRIKINKEKDKNNAILLEYAINNEVKSNNIDLIHKIMLNRLSESKNLEKLIIKLSDNYQIIRFLKNYDLQDKSFFISSMMILLVNIPQFLHKLKNYQDEYIIPKISKNLIKRLNIISLGLNVQNNIIAYRIQNNKIKIIINPSKDPEILIPISRKNLGIIAIGNFIPSNLVESEMWNCDEKFLEFLDALFPNQKMLIYPNDGF